MGNFMDETRNGCLKCVGHEYIPTLLLEKGMQTEPNRSPFGKPAVTQMLTSASRVATSSMCKNPDVLS